MNRLLTVLLGVALIAGMAGATAWSNTTARGDLDTLEAVFEKVDSIFGNPLKPAAYGRQPGSIYVQIYNLRTTSIDGQTVSDAVTSKRKSIQLNGAEQTLNNEWNGCPFWLGRGVLSGYALGIARANGVSMDAYWHSSIYDSTADTARVGWAVAEACRAYGIGKFRAAMCQPRPEQTLGYFKYADSTYHDSLELSSVIAGGGLLEVYVTTKISCTDTAGCTLRIAIKGKDMNGSLISDTVRVPATKFAVGSKVSIGAQGKYYANVTDIDLNATTGVGASPAGIFDVRTRVDRNVR